MLVKSEGIVIRSTRFSETTVIAKIFTREKGMLSFYIPGVYGKKPAVRPSYLQVLQILDLNFYFRENRNLNKIGEAKPAIILSQLYYEIKKSSVALFISEIILRTVREEEKNESMYHFLRGMIIHVDQTEENLSLIPLQFLIEYCRYTGFYPTNNYSSVNIYFNLVEGKFSPVFPGFEYGMDEEESKLLSNLIENGQQAESNLHSTLEIKNSTLTKLIDYFRYHLPGLGNIKSFEILKEIY